MKTISIRPLSKEAFSQYGDYASITTPASLHFGDHPVRFFRDMLQMQLGKETNVSFSCCTIDKREMIIDALEYHNYTCETILVLDADYIMPVAPAVGSEKMPAEKIEAFFVPKGTAVTCRPGVWHGAGYVSGAEELHVLCCLPERTYMNDCFVDTLTGDERVIIK